MSTEGVREVSGDIARIASRKRKILLAEVVCFFLLWAVISLEHVGYFDIIPEQVPFPYLFITGAIIAWIFLVLYWAKKTRKNDDKYHIFERRYQSIIHGFGIVSFGCQSLHFFLFSVFIITRAIAVAIERLVLLTPSAITSKFSYFNYDYVDHIMLSPFFWVTFFITLFVSTVDSESKGVSRDASMYASDTLVRVFDFICDIFVRMRPGVGIISCVFFILLLVSTILLSWLPSTLQDNGLVIFVHETVDLIYSFKITSDTASTFLSGIIMVPIYWLIAGFFGYYSLHAFLNCATMTRFYFLKLCLRNAMMNGEGIKINHEKKE